VPHHVVRCPAEPSFVAGFERIRAQFDVPPTFPDHVLDASREAARAGPVTPPGADASVRDRRDIEFVAIDPAGSTDLDQAFAAERMGDGHRVFYAIADVAAFVAPGGPIDLEARERGLTLYSPDRRTSLHPESISEGAGSLLEGQDRQALLWTIDLDGEGQLVSAHVERAMVRNRRQLSYRAAQERAGEATADDPLTLLREIGERRIEREAKRGAVSLALPPRRSSPPRTGRTFSSTTRPYRSRTGTRRSRCSQASPPATSCSTPGSVFSAPFPSPTSEPSQGCDAQPGHSTSSGPTTSVTPPASELSGPTPPRTPRC
jgi:hypothetical protein